jgi:hypothetical protein
MDTRDARERAGHGWCPQRDSNPCYRLERPATHADSPVLRVLGRSERVPYLLWWPCCAFVRPTNRSTAIGRNGRCAARTYAGQISGLVSGALEVSRRAES